MSIILDDQNTKLLGRMSYYLLHFQHSAMFKVRLVPLSHTPNPSIN